jgi:phosphoserine aminotransferase
LLAACIPTDYWLKTCRGIYLADLAINLPDFAGNCFFTLISRITSANQTMSKLTYLTPGPSELYFTVPDHIQTALKTGVCSISHRSKAFEGHYQHAVEQLRLLLNLPEGYHVVFTGSATEVWERAIENGAGSATYHLVNGSFSKRFYEFSTMLGRKAYSHEVPEGQGFSLEGIDIPEEVELVCTTYNETSTGVSMPLEDIYALKARYPEKLMIVDAVSAIPFPDVAYQKIDSLFFSVQKGMGMPAGLGVWLFNEKFVEKVQQLQARGLSLGTYHSIPALLEKAVKNQTPETPNVLGIYLLGKVCEDMNRRGIQAIRQETLYKAAVTYQAFEAHPYLTPFVQDPRMRSKTVMVANVLEKEASALIQYLQQHGLAIGSGYGKLKASQVRVANFPTHSKEVFHQLVDLLAAWSV